MKGKVLYTTSTASPQSGAFKIMLDVARGARRQGYDTMFCLPSNAQGVRTLLSEAERETAFFLNLPQVRRGQSIRYYVDYLKQNTQSILALSRAIREEGVTLVHANEIFDLYAGVAARATGARCVWSIRADLSPWPVLESLLPRVVTYLSDAVTVASNSVRERMFQWTGIDRSRVSVIYDPGLDFSEFHPDVDGTSVRKEFGLGEDDFLVTLVAKLAERKGHETLIRAAPKVLASLPNTYFLLVGGELPGDHHEEYARYLKSLPRSLGVVDRVIFTGFRPDVPEVMAASDIIVHCSVYPDPFPGVVLQGMAVGKSVIASDIGGPREQIEDRVSGVLVEPGNSTALGQAVCSLLHDEKKREALGKAAVERVQALFGAESYSKKISNLYESVISQSR